MEATMLSEAEFEKWYRKAVFRDKWLKWLTFPLAIVLLFMPFLLAGILGIAIQRKHAGIIPTIKSFFRREESPEEEE